ncbi:6810_t:CDS:1, partial [Dentiscutata erythropus]
EFNNNETYDLLKAFPSLLLTKHSSKPNHIPICASYKTTAKHYSAPTLDSISEELNNVPIYHCCWLSPIHLSYSLGCAESSNQFTHYCHLTSDFGLSKNICALHLYSGTLGAILDPNANNNWFHDSLLYVAN